MVLQKIQALRERARQHISQGAITPDYQLDRDQSIRILNEALATELVCTLRYQFHYFMATGIHSQAVKEEFKEHAREEQEHAERIAERIRGDPVRGSPGLPRAGTCPATRVMRRPQPTRRSLSRRP